jgi:hypothetical protein
MPERDIIDKVRNILSCNRTPHVSETSLKIPKG